MINAKQLRIGNWVTYHGETDMPCQLDAQDILNISTNYMHNAEIHSPIPLTPEVLERCGFVKEYESRMHTTFYMDGVMSYYFWHENKTQYANVKGLQIDCHYLHQLQNILFDLCGQELEYKPKV